MNGIKLTASFSRFHWSPAAETEIKFGKTTSSLANLMLIKVPDTTDFHSV